MTDLDYCSLRHLDSVETSEGYQLESYLNTRDMRYAALVREGRFGKVVGETTGIRNREDLQQLLVAAEDEETDLKEVFG